MIKKLLSIFLALTIFFTLALPVYAGTVEFKPCAKHGGSSFQTLCDLSTGSVGKVIQNGITVLFIVAVIATLFFLIFGGIKWITSGGDKAQLEIARNTIIAAIIGLVLVLSSFFILNIALNFFGLPNATKFNVPSLGTGGACTAKGKTCSFNVDCCSNRCTADFVGGIPVGRSCK